MKGFRFGGRGIRKKQGQMNGTEARYALYLKELNLRGEVVWFEFDSVKLRLADATFYSPDFMVLTNDLTVEFHEVKGSYRARNQKGEIKTKPFVEDDAAVKIKVAADKFPFRFFMVWLSRNGWEKKEYGHGD